MTVERYVSTGRVAVSAGHMVPFRPAWSDLDYVIFQWICTYVYVRVGYMLLAGE